MITSKVSDNSPISENWLTYEANKVRLAEEFHANAKSPIRLQKKTASNLFRYIRKIKKIKKSITIKEFNSIISIDTKKMTLDVEGLVSYENIIRLTLQYQLLPTVSPELKDITIGGAIVGIGIESTCFKNGFVHDGLLEAEVLLPNGQIVLCTPDNEHADLFYALPNSYGTLGYILRAKIRLYPAKAYVHIQSQRYYQSTLFLDAMRSAMNNPAIDFIEGLAFSKDEFYLLSSRFTDTVTAVDDIYHKHIFYKLAKAQEDIYLSTEDYIFRYDPDWFWNIPDNAWSRLFRIFAPKQLRNSGFYKKCLDFKNTCLAKLGVKSSHHKNKELLFQDWEVPWENADTLLSYAIGHINLNGKPWVTFPIKPLQNVTLYPLKANTIYFNLGCYCQSTRNLQADGLFYNANLMDAICFSLDGLKMLYSSTQISPDKFADYYNGAAYCLLKKKYDPENLAGSLYEKVAVDCTVT